MALNKRILILFAFGTRLLQVEVARFKSLARIISYNLTHSSFIAIVVMRLVYLSPGAIHRPPVTNIVSNVLAEGALQFSIISASISSLRPFLRSLHPGYLIDGRGALQPTYNKSNSLSGTCDSPLEPHHKPKAGTCLDKIRASVQRTGCANSLKEVCGEDAQQVKALCSQNKLTNLVNPQVSESILGSSTKQDDERGRSKDRTVTQTEISLPVHYEGHT